MPSPDGPTVTIRLHFPSEVAVTSRACATTIFDFILARSRASLESFYALKAALEWFQASFAE
jgi:hypothetical protein